MPRPSLRRAFSDTLLAAVFAMAAVIAIAVGFANDARGAPIGDFDLTTGTFFNAGTAGGNLTLAGVVSGGSGNFTASGWTWSGASSSPGSGLVLAGLPATHNGTFSQYTIAVEFDFGQVSSYRRLMLLQPGTDSGLYVNSGKFEIVGYSPPNNFSGNITANNKANIVVTRTSTGNVTVYQVSDPETPTPTADQLFTFTDSSNIMVRPGNGTMEFFRDEAGGSDFSSSGNASLIKIWDAPLTADEVKFAFVPEPATIALLAVAGGGAILYLRRRFRSLR